MPDVALDVLPEHGVSVHVLGRQAAKEFVADSIRGEEDYLGPALHLEEGLVFHNEVDFVDRLEISAAYRASMVSRSGLLIVSEGPSLDASGAEELSEFKEVQRRDVQDIEAHSKELLLGCRAGACLQTRKLVGPVEDLSQLGLGEVSEHFAY